MKIPTLLLLSFITSFTFAQKDLPIIRATSNNVAINDGGYLDKNAWSLSPEAKPDVYTADRSLKTKFVTFYTDIDSIKVKLKPGAKFDFIILLNGKDSCFTQIVSSKSLNSPLRTSKNACDTIPFTLTSYQAIHVKAIINNIDSLNLHLDMGTLDFRLTRTAILSKTKLLSNQPDALAGKTKPNFGKMNKINTIQIGNLIWDNPTVQIANNVAKEMDGRFGWRAFDDKVLEIDYDKMCIIVYSSLPKKKKEFVKSDIKFIQSLFCVEANVEIADKKYKGNFLFDTGSDLAMILDSAWMANLSFPQNLKLIKKSSFSDGSGRKYETNIVSVPSLKITNFSLNNIPTSLLGYKSPVGNQINYFGNDLLKRFNVIIDLQKDKIYYKPNSLTSVPYIGKS
jgi:hypothetical protein